MDRRQAEELLASLRGVAIARGPSELTFAAGLTDVEVERTEVRYGFRFPPDLRLLLQLALPIGPRFPNWRADPETKLRDWLDLPRDGILFDVENNDVWLDEWGTKPPTVDGRKHVATELIASAPALVPIYGHRMIPDEPHLPGNPVFSVHQTDIIYYGSDLSDYFRNEFHFPELKPRPDAPRRIRFWDIERFTDIRWADGPCAFNNRGMPYT